MQFSELISEVQKRLEVSAVSSFIGSPTIKTWLNQAQTWACNTYPWPEMQESKTSTTTTEEYYDYPENWLMGSIKILKVENKNGKMKQYEKVLFDDYEQYKEDYEEGEAKIYSEFAEYYFINTYAYNNTAGRAIEIWGQKEPAKLSADTDKLPIRDERVEEAVIKRALVSGWKKKEADKRATREFKESRLLLQQAWSDIKQKQSAFKSKDKSMFKRIDILQGRILKGKGPKRLQF